MARFLDPPKPKAALPAEKVDKEYKSMRLKVFLGAFLGYAAYYLVRKNLSLAAPDMIADGILDAGKVGLAMSAVSIAYAFSKFVMGSVSDRSDARKFLVVGLVLSALVMMSVGLIPFGTNTALNTAVIFVLMLISILPNIMSSLEGMVGDLSRHIGLVLLITVGILVVLYGLILVIRRLQFKYLTYQLTADEFVVHSGIITKRHAQIPYQRIQAIDQQASLLQRLAGVCTLKISTAGGASNRAVMLEYLLNADAQALREELFARKQWQLAVAAGQVPAGVPYGAAPVAYGGDSALGYGETAGQAPVAGAAAGV